MADNQATIKVPVSIEPVVTSVQNLSSIFDKFKDDKSLSIGIRNNMAEGLKVVNDFYQRVSQFKTGQSISPIDMQNIQKDADKTAEVLKGILTQTTEAYKKNPVSTAISEDLKNAQNVIKQTENQISKLKGELGTKEGKVTGLQRFETTKEQKDLMKEAGAPGLGNTVEIDKVAAAYDIAYSKVTNTLKGVRTQITNLNKAAAGDEKAGVERANLVREQAELEAQGRKDEAAALQPKIDALTQIDKFGAEELKRQQELLATEKLLAAQKEELKTKIGTPLKTQLAERDTKQTELTKASDQLSKDKEKETNAQIEYNKALEVGKDLLESTKQGTSVYNSAVKSLNADLAKAVEDQKKYTAAVNSTEKGINNAINRFIGFRAIYNQLHKILRDGIKVVQDLDKAFTEMAMVTNYTTKETWAMKDAFAKLAAQTGLTITQVAKMGVEFFRQGRSYSQMIKLVEAAGVAAKVAGISTEDSIKYLTSAVNGYHLSVNQAIVVSDKFAALAATSATDYEELAVALSKVAAQAYTAGVSMDNMMGFIAKALEVTREAPENIGTAFKTIFARMSELKDFGATVEDGMDINRIDKALSTIGVSLRDNNGELRNLDQVLIDVGSNWEGLTKNQKAYITTALAGTRQQTRLLAVFEDFDRTMQLVESSADSLGASYAQMSKYYGSIEYAQANFTNAWQDFVSNIVQSSVFIQFNNFLADMVISVNALTQAFGGWGTAIAVVLIPGLALLAKGLLGVILSTVTELGLAKQKIATDMINLDLKQAELAALNAEWDSLQNLDAQKMIDLGLTQASLEAKLEDLKARGLILESDIAEIASSVTKTQATFGEIFARKFNITLIKEQIKTQAALILSTLVYAAAIALVVVAFIKIYQYLDRVNIAEKKFHETQKKLIADAYNIRKNAKEVKALKDEYIELDKKLVKTTEDYERMNSIIQSIKDAVGEDFADLMSIGDGQLNTEELDKWLTVASNKLNNKWKEIENNLLQQYGSFKDALASNTITDVEKAQLTVLSGYYEFQKDRAHATMEDFLNLDSQLRATYEQIAKINNLIPKNSTVSGITVDWSKTYDEQSKAFKELMAGMQKDVGQFDVAKAGFNPLDTIFNSMTAVGNVNQTAEDLANATGLSGEKLFNLIEEYYSEGEDEFLKKEIWDVGGIQQKAKQEVVTYIKNMETGMESALPEAEKKISTYVQNLNKVGFQNTNNVADQFSILSSSGLLQETEILPGMDKSIKDLVTDSDPAIQTLLKIKETVEAEGYSFDEVAPKIQYSTKELQNLKDALDNMPLSETIDKNKIWADTIIYGADVAYAKLGGQISDTSEGMRDAIQVANTLADTLDKFTVQDLSYQLDNLHSIGTNIDNINKMLSGEDPYDMSKMQEYLNMYPELIGYIRQEGEVSQDAADVQSAAMKKTLIDNLKIKRASLETELHNTELEMEAVKALLDGKVGLMLDEFGIEKEINEDSYDDYIYWATKAIVDDPRTDQATKDRLTPALITYKKAAEESDVYALSNAFLANQYDSLSAKAQNLNGEILNIDLAIQDATNSVVVSGKEADKAADKVDMYISKMSRIRVLGDAIKDLTDSLSLLEAQQDNLTGSDFIDNMDKQDNIIQATNKLLEEQNDAYRDAQDVILNDLDPALKSSIKVIDGQMYVTEDYLKLNGNQMEAIDEMVDTFNGYSESINKNSSSMEANIKKIEEFNKKKLEIVDKTKQLVIDAIKAEYEERKTKAEAAFNEEKKWLDKRKALYEDAFNQEEYVSSLEELQKQREDIINRLASLEGSVNVTEYQTTLEEKDSIDKEINDKIVERNKEALLNLLDEEQNQLDQAQEANNEYYDAKINNIEELEARAIEIINSGVDQTLEYLKAHNPEYKEATAEGKEMMLTEWRDMVSQAITIMNEIESNIPDLDTFVAEIESTADALGNATIEALKLADALNAVADAKKRVNEEDDSTTTTTTGTVYEYGGSADPNNPWGVAGGVMTQKNSNTPTVKEDWNTTVRTMKTNAQMGKPYQTEVNKLLNLLSVYPDIKPKGIINNGVGSYTGTPYAVTDYRRYQEYKTGGLASYTGLAMLHGSPTKPERVLSSVQTELFDKMVKHLEDLSSPTTVSGNTSNESISIANINISTPQLNSALDFNTAGKSLAKELKTALNERGLNINKKR